MVEIRLENLRKTFGDIVATDRVNMTIKEGELSTLLGPSGCGKSTFLRSFNRMNDVILKSRTEGEILLDEKNIYDTDVDVVEIRRKIGIVFQNPDNQFVGVTVEDDIAFGMENLNFERLDMLDKIEEFSKEE